MNETKKYYILLDIYIILHVTIVGGNGRKRTRDKINTKVNYGGSSTLACS